MIRRSQPGFTPEVARQLAFTLLVGGILAIVEGGGGQLVSLVFDVIAGKPHALETLREVAPGAVGVIAGLILAVSSLFVYARWASQLPTAIREVTRPAISVQRFTLIERVFLIPLFRSRMRMTIGGGFLVTILVYLLARSFVPPVLLAIIVIVLLLNVLREIQTGHGGTREAIGQIVEQKLKTLGRHVEHALEKALKQTNIGIRCHIMIFEEAENVLKMRYSYQMQGDPDWELELSPNQCIRGRALQSGIPQAANPYKPKKLGFSTNEMGQLPNDIAWMIAQPLRTAPNVQPLGVLGVDGRTPISEEWMDKLRDYTHAIATGLGIIFRVYLSEGERGR